jgi:hypothetical protein
MPPGTVVVVVELDAATTVVVGAGEVVGEVSPAPGTPVEEHAATANVSTLATAPRHLTPRVSHARPIEWSGRRDAPVFR